MTDVEERVPLKMLEGHTKGVTSVAWSPIYKFVCRCGQYTCGHGPSPHADAPPKNRQGSGAFPYVGLEGGGGRLLAARRQRKGRVCAPVWGSQRVQSLAQGLGFGGCNVCTAGSSGGWGTLLHRDRRRAGELTAGEEEWARRVGDGPVCA
eukprot:365129-Chlamydomonas_euryale.AAC.14